MALLFACTDQQSVDSIYTPRSLNEETLPILPLAVDSNGGFDRDKGPRTNEVLQIKCLC